jgi:hypothetical protein
VREVRIVDIVGLLSAEGFQRGRVAIQMRAINLGITRDRVNYWTEPEKKIAHAGLKAGKPHREILAELKDAGFHRGVTSLFKFSQKNNYRRASEIWTLDQTDTLRKLYEKKTPVKEISEIMGKTIGAIRARASNLGLKQRVAWTEKEYAVLRKFHAAGQSLMKTATEIGRPYANVARVAQDIGLDFNAKRQAAKKEKKKGRK